MNIRDSEFDRMLAEWLEDDTFVAPAAPVEAAVDFARIHPRRRDWLTFLRRDAMTTRATTGLRPVAILLAVVALLALGVGGAVYVASRPEATPTPTVLPSPTTSPLAVLPMPPSGALVAGRYRLEVPDSPVTVDLTIGEGWTSGDWYIMNPPEFTHHISFWTVGNVNEDACDWNGTLPNPPIGPTVDDLVSALDAQKNTDMSAPIEVEVGGHAGKQVTVQIAADFTPPEGTCDPDLTIWVGPDGEQGRSVTANLDNPPDTVWILDVDGQRVVIVTTYDPSDAEAQMVMDSLEFAVN
jgi:hypothetical protein